MQKHVNLVDLVKSFPTNIFLQNLASIQKRTSPIKFAHLAEKSGKGSISNLSTKARALARAAAVGERAGLRHLVAREPLAHPVTAGGLWDVLTSVVSDFMLDFFLQGHRPVV